MKKNKKLSALCWVLAFIISIGLWALGLLCSEAIPHALWISFIVIFLVPTAYLVNHVGYKRFVRKLNAMPMAQRLEMLTSKQNAVRDNLEAVMLKRHKTCLWVKVYIISLLLIVLLMCFMCGAASKEHNSTIQLLLALYILKDILNRLFVMNKIEEGEDFLPEADYPVLYSMARKAAEECGVKDEFKIFVNAGTTAGIGTVGKTRCLYLGALLLDLFSEEELYQTLLHEFGHVTDSNYTVYQMEAEKLLRFMSLGDGSQSNLMTAVFMELPAARLALENELVNVVSSIEAEKKADSTILRCGNPQVFISGLAKLCTYSYFNDYSTTLPPFHASETPRTDIVTMLSEHYRKEFEVHKEQWMYMLEHELPARLDSHPSFPERRAAMGNCDFAIEFTDPDTPCRRECHKVIDYVNGLLANQASPEDYEQARKEFYLKPLAVIEEYEASEKEYSSDELSPILNAYRDTAQFDKAEALADSIIANEKNPYATAHALSVKGFSLLRRYDADGIEYLYKAAELNENYKESGLDEVGKFCLRMGLEDELQRYRDTMDSYIEGGIDEYIEMGRLTDKDKIVPEKFPDNRLPHMLDFMVSAGSGTIEEIYLVRKLVNEELFTSVFVLKFAADADHGLCEKAYEKIFNYLDTYPDGWQYTLLELDKSLAKILKKVPEALVYKK